MPILGSRILSTNPHVSQRQPSFPFLDCARTSWPCCLSWYGASPSWPFPSTPAPRGPGPGKRLIRHVSGTDKAHTPCTPHVLSSPAFPAAWTCRKACWQKEPHPPRQPGHPVSSPRGLPSQQTHSLGCHHLWGSFVHHSCPREAGKVRSESSAPQAPGQQLDWEPGGGVTGSSPRVELFWCWLLHT